MTGLRAGHAGNSPTKCEFSTLTQGQASLLCGNIMMRVHGALHHKHTKKLVGMVGAGSSYSALLYAESRLSGWQNCEED
jgi:hypothetical protein